MNKITEKQYVESYNPLGAWVLIQKFKLPEKSMGGIILTDSTRNKEVKVSMVGTIVAKSKFTSFPDPLDTDMMAAVEIGDVVGFSATVPMLSPLPPDLTFDGENQFVTLHVGDILAKLDTGKLYEIK